MKLSNGIEYTANFDWDETKGKKLVVFMPNYKFSHLTEFTISQIRTKVDPNKWIIIVGNDGVDVNWDHLKDKGVRYFTLKRGVNERRNPSFIRNFAIKRCQSEHFFVKDGEVVVLGDFIYNAINFHFPWKAGRISVLNEKQTAEYMANPESFQFPLTKITEMMVAQDATQVKATILEADGKVNPSTYFSYAYSIRLDALKEIRGYDEDYTDSDWEDSDIFCRLFHMKHFLVPDYTCMAVHLYHSRDHVLAKIARMKDIFLEKSPQEPFRNPNGWGEGK
jgi:hypothetical protein